jgi:hypothetical protein
MCAPYGVGRPPNLAPRARIVTDLMPEQSAATNSTSSAAHDAHCRIFVGDGSTGSGTLISRNDATGLVLTCSHLFDESTSDIVVAFPDCSRFAARLIDRDQGNVLAALFLYRHYSPQPAVSPPAREQTFQCSSHQTKCRRTSNLEHHDTASFADSTYHS